MNDVGALLSIADDKELCDAVFDRFADFCNVIDVEECSEEERVVTLVWQASGILENGGFEYLLAGEFNGDEEFVQTAEAFRVIGARESHAAFRRALGVFGEEYPRNAKQRGAIFQAVPEAERKAMNEQFWNDAPNVPAGLAAYIRERRERFAEVFAELAEEA